MKKPKLLIFGVVFIGTLIVFFLEWYWVWGWDSALIWIIPAEIVFFFIFEMTNRWVAPPIIRLLNKYDASKKAP